MDDPRDDLALKTVMIASAIDILSEYTFNNFADILDVLLKCGVLTDKEHESIHGFASGDLKVSLEPDNDE